jgi:hypothetical protein
MAARYKTSPTVVLLRVFSAAGIFVGLAGIMFSNPSLFWCAAVFLYAGLFGLAFDIRQELKLKRQRRWRWVGWSVIVIVAGAFTLGIAFYPARIVVQPVSYEGDYKVGESEYGIVWSDDMSDLRVDLENPTERDYDHIDLTIAIGNLLIRDQRQVTHIPNVTLIPFAHQVHINKVDENGKPTGEENRSMDAYSQVRILCDKIPKKSTVGLILAVSELSPAAKSAIIGDPSKGLKPGESHILDIFVKPPYRTYVRHRAEVVTVTGDFAVWNRPFHLDRAYPVAPE